jgi:TPR repeat protein/uncharacterized membrane protein YhaH (DUF805 family)
MTRHLPVALALLVPLGGCSLPEAPAQTTAPPTTLDTELASVQQRAEEGDAAAQFKLGDMYRYGSGVPQDFAQALAWYRKAAEQGHAFAQNNLGMAYGTGQSVPQDDAQAVSWYRKAADQEDPDAQYNLGVSYAIGQGVPPDYVEAAAWYRKAAEQGHADAQSNLGVMHDTGQGVPQDFAQAVAWYSKAADQGYAEAQYQLGGRYWRGQGVPQDYVQAHMWYSLAASRLTGENRERYAEARDAVAAKMTPAQIAEAQKLAREWHAAFDARQEQGRLTMPSLQSIEPAGGPFTEKGPFEWCLDPYKEYGNYRGRARRKEFWCFYLFYFIAFALLSLLQPHIGLFFMFVSYIPAWCVSIRRMHDIDHRGWWLLFPVVNVILICLDGTRGRNRFGADPKTASEQQAAFDAR